MGEHKIGWLNVPGYKGESFNPITGCSPISIGCDRCYARRMALRFPKVYPKGFNVHLRPERLDIPLRWKKPRACFLGSMTDLFHDEVPFEFLDRIFAVVARSPQHLFLVLSKRPERMRRYFLGWPDGMRRGHHIANHIGDGKGPTVELPMPNLFLGVTAENQEMLDLRAPFLLDTPAALRFISFEPLLSEIQDVDFTGISWCICGGESGPKARFMEPEWALNLLRQCQAANVPYFMKQMSRREPIPLILNVREFPDVRRDR